MKTREREAMTIGDYRDAVDRIRHHFEQVPESVRPVSILQNGSVGTAGVSDLDLIFIFPDDFDSGAEFGDEYRRATASIRHREILFVHQPMLLGSSAACELPRYTHNPVDRLNLIMGDPPAFKVSHAPPVQSMLISLEFIQFRLVQLISQLAGGTVSLQGILLRGHSMIHSIRLAEQAGITLEAEKFRAFTLIESIRDQIREGKRMSLTNSEIKKLQKGVIGEFYYLYGRFCDRVAQSVSFYLPPSDHYRYDKGVEMANLFDETGELKRAVTPQGVTFQGFHWVNMMLRELYFQEGNETFLADPDFTGECRLRARFHREQWAWNKRIFNTIHAGLSPMPCIIGDEAVRCARSSWGIS